MKAYVCKICGYIHMGEEAPNRCPMCGASKEKFEVKEEKGGNNMKELKGTKTEKNLMEAFAGESQARNKYTYFASKAKKEGYEQIAAIFQETADNEKEHAKMWFKLLNGGEISDTASNLKSAAEGELSLIHI